MGLFGPSQEQITEAVSNGIHRAIRTTRSTRYEVKQGKKMVQGEYYSIPPTVEVELVEFGSEMPIMPPIRRVRLPNGYFVIYDVIYIETQTVYNPFTDKSITDTLLERNVARYYSYDGYNMDKINRFIRFAREHGYYPSEEYLEKRALEAR